MSIPVRNLCRPQRPAWDGRFPRGRDVLAVHEGVHEDILSIGDDWQCASGRIAAQFVYDRGGGMLRVIDGDPRTGTPKVAAGANQCPCQRGNRRLGRRHRNVHGNVALTLVRAPRFNESAQVTKQAAGYFVHQLEAAG